MEELLWLQTSSENFPLSETGPSGDTEYCNKQTECMLLKNPRKGSTLSCDIIDVTEYGKDGIKIIDGDLKNFEVNGMVNKHEKFNKIVHEDNKFDLTPTENYYDDILESIETNLCGLQTLIESSPNFSHSISQMTPNTNNSPLPRLIRSNSYTLENPSPILLAHLDKFGDCQNWENENKKTSSNIKNLSSLENDYIPFGKSEYNSVVIDCEKSIDKNSSENFDSENNKDEIEQSKIEVIQTDISVQHITLDCNKRTCEETGIQKSSLELVDPNCQLIEVLKSIPDDYSKKILDLIEKQQTEECSKIIAENCQEINNLTNSNGSININGSNCDNLLKYQDETTWCNNILKAFPAENDIDNLILSPSQSINYTLSSTCTALPTSPFLQLVDLESDDMEPQKNGDVHIRETLTLFHKKQLENCKRKLNFKQERFNQFDEEITTIKEVSF